MQETLAPSRALPAVKLSVFDPVPKLLDRLGDAFERHGDVVQVKGFPVNVVCFRHPDHIAQLLKHKAVGLTKHPEVMPRVRWVMRRGAYILRGGDEWMRKRRQVQPGFTGDAVVGYTDALAPIISDFLNRWPAAAGPTTLDIYDQLRRLITDVNFKLFCQTDLGPRLAEVEHDFHYVEKRLVAVAPLWLPTPSNIRFKRATYRLREVMLDLIRQRRAEPGGKEDVLALLIGLRDETTGQPWPDELIVDELFSIFFGASVMATTLAWELYLIAGRPDVRERLLAEAGQVLQGREPTAADFPKLTYSHQVFNEATRLYPPSWGFPRYADEALEIDGYSIPPKTLVIPMVYHTHRHPAFWAAPLEFDPDRFAPERAAGIHPLAHFPFGAGPRKCLGANLGPRVIELVTLMLLRRHALRFRPRFAGDPVPEFGFELCPKDAVVMEVQRAGGAASPL